MLLTSSVSLEMDSMRPGLGPDESSRAVFSSCCSTVTAPPLLSVTEKS